MNLPRKQNSLSSSPFYAEILTEFNRQLAANGDVNASRFWDEVIRPKMPAYKLKTWYAFLSRFKTANGLTPLQSTSPVSPEEAEKAVATTMTSNQESTSQMVQRILFLAAEASKRMTEDPAHITDADRKAVELGIKIMKAQDSRIHAIGKIKEDNREEEKMQRVFNNAAYG